jgi:hypothetical protein
LRAHQSRITDAEREHLLSALAKVHHSAGDLLGRPVSGT